jgi:hypothetical protein
MMIEDTEPGRSMVRYLLGEMPEAERVGFEDRYLDDDAMFYELVELETDLIDLYALGGLSAPDRKRLERSFLADPVRRQRLALARSLNSQVVHETQDVVEPTGSARAWQSLRAVRGVAAALALVALPLVIWLLLANRRLRNEVEASRRAQADASSQAWTLQARIEQLNRELEHGSAGTAQVDSVGARTQVVAEFMLGPDVSRGGGEAPTLRLPSEATVVRLSLSLPVESSRYALTLETADGARVWRQQVRRSRAAPADGEHVSFDIPATALADGDYVLRVTAESGGKAEDLAGCSFQVARR